MGGTYAGGNAGDPNGLHERVSARRKDERAGSETGSRDAKDSIEVPIRKRQEIFCLRLLHI